MIFTKIFGVFYWDSTINFKAVSCLSLQVFRFKEKQQLFISIFKFRP